MGTAVASLLSAAPWLVSFSRHKMWTFSIAGTLVAASFVVTYVVAPRLPEGEACAADDPTTCGEVSKLSRVIRDPLGIGAHLEWRILRRVPARAAAGTHGSLESRPGRECSGFPCESIQPEMLREGPAEVGAKDACGCGQGGEPQTPCSSRRSNEKIVRHTIPNSRSI